jgi:hypothetical protein
MNSSDQRQPRRDFLGQIAASAAVVAGVAYAPSLMAQQPARSASPATAGAWDDSWVGRLTAKHKAVFDSPQIENGMALLNTLTYLQGMRDVQSAGAGAVQAVIVIRAMAIPMAFNDAMWKKYEIGKIRKIKESNSDNWVTANPYLNGAGGWVGAAPSPDGMAATMAWLGSHGNILLGCDIAVGHFANEIARDLKLDATAVTKELKANLVPGMILQPSGVYAAARAQEAGCVYVHVRSA